jgi:hypothetical protein
MTELGTSDVTLRVSVPPTAGLAFPTVAWHPGIGAGRGGVVPGSVRRAAVVAGEDGGAGGRDVGDTDAAAITSDDGGDEDPFLADLDGPDVEVELAAVLSTPVPGFALPVPLVASAVDVVGAMALLAFFFVEARSIPITAATATMSATTENHSQR